MPHPYPDAPSIKQFVDNATLQGCVEGVFEKTGKRYLESSDGIVAFLPSKDDDALISPLKLAQLVRRLGVKGYEDFLVANGYGEDGADKPSNEAPRWPWTLFPIRNISLPSSL